MAALISLVPLLHGDRSTFCLTTDTAVCSYTADHFALVIQLLVLGGALLTALLSLHDTRKLPVGEYWFLLLSSAVARPCCPPHAISPLWSSPSKSPPCPPSPWSG